MPVESLTRATTISLLDSAKLTSSVKQISRIVTKSKSRDKKQQGKYNEMVKTLIDEYGYNEDSAEEVIKFAANNLWRDS